MSDKTLKDLTVDAHIAVLHTKVDALIEKQKELTERVRANEKVVAALGVLGSIAIAFIGAGALAPRAEACSQPLDVDGSPANCGPGDRIIYHEDKEPNYDYYSTRDEIIWNASTVIQKMREWKSEQDRTPIDDSINNALLELEIDYGSDDTTEQEELLQFPSDGDYESIGWRYDRCSDRLGVRSVQEGEGKDSGC